MGRTLYTVGILPTIFLVVLASLLSTRHASADEAQLIEDDGKTLWASPTAGAPLIATFWPNDVKLVIAVRLADLLASDEGQRVYQALGPRIGGMVDLLQSSTQRKLSDFASIVLAASPEGDQLPRWTLEAQMVDNEPIRWNIASVSAPTNLRPQARDGHYHRLKDQAWFEFASAEGTRLVAGNEKKVLEQLDAESLSGIHSRQLETLIKASDDRRHVTVLVSLSFLLGDGKKWFPPALNWIVDAVDRLQFENVDALLLSFHLGPEHQFYGEAQVFHRLDARPRPLSLKLQAEIEKVPDRIEKWLVDLEMIDKHWRRLAMRLPQMTNLLTRQTRVAVEEQHPVITFSLPAHAAHNFVAAIELAFASANMSTTRAPMASKTASPIKSWKSLLRQPLDLDIRQDSLEATLQILQSQIVDVYPAIEFPFRIRILGSDLRKEGITRNQQIRNLRRSGETISDLLTAIVMSANPITTVKSPAEADQKLIWTIAPDPDVSSERIILITTRKAAESKNYPLPPAFRP
jgi:hypothetical protein